MTLKVVADGACPCQTLDPIIPQRGSARAPFGTPCVTCTSVNNMPFRVELYKVRDRYVLLMYPAYVGWFSLLPTMPNLYLYSLGKLALLIDASCNPAIAGPCVDFLNCKLFTGAVVLFAQAVALCMYVRAREVCLSVGLWTK